MSDLNKAQAAQEANREKRRRSRWRVFLVTASMFVLAFGVLSFRLIDGEDPAMRAVAATQSANSGSSTTTTESTTEDDSTYQDDDSYEDEGEYDDDEDEDDYTYQSPTTTQDQSSSPAPTTGAS